MITQCTSYNWSTNKTSDCKDSLEKCFSQIDCAFEQGRHCYGVYDNISHPISLGCAENYKDSPDEKCGNECIGQPRGKRYYCCCIGNLCNRNITLPTPKTDYLVPRNQEADLGIQPDRTNGTWPVIPFVFLVLIIALVLVFWYRRSNNRRYKGVSGNSELQQLHHQPHQQQQHHPQNEYRIDLNSIKLLEVIGSGRFGTVHRATLSNETNSEIAVKIITSSGHQSWLNEQQIYMCPKVKHPNILNFLYSDEHLETESYWLIVEYASKGSLYTFLTENIVDWKEFLHIALGIVHGLSHLHEADIAHRDFKSKNVLLKHDLTPCITDFGVATILDTSTGSQLDHKKKYLQVGTPRYMAPEVLECSVTFTKASFTKIDVYALSLVLWELISRCHPLSHDPPPYRLPFEEIAGPQPDINKMRQIVVVEKLRPPLRDDWRVYPASELCRAIEDGWEYDHDARISASCFVERVESLLL